MTTSFYTFLVLVLGGLHVILEPAFAAPVGIYGIRQNNMEMLTRHRIETVFVAPQRELIEAQVAAGRQVFLTLNAFGGRQAWTDYPGSVPVTASGKVLGDGYGGVCPTHAGWRESRLALLAEWVEKYGGEGGISGIFLDYTRYPGKWERAHPVIPDSCWCPRCLELFQQQKNIYLPHELPDVSAKVAWIKEHAPLEWMEWKKEQITSFVREVKTVLENNQAGRKLVLGVFLVPWRKSDFDGAISFLLAQDALQFASFVDVLSPMVYHRMVGQPVAWIGEVTDYFAGSTGAEVWPIVQAEDVDREEFSRVIETLSSTTAKRLLVYTMTTIKGEQWPLLERFIAKNDLLQDAVPNNEGSLNNPGAIELTTGYERQRTDWSTDLPACEPGGSYLFSGEFFRRDRVDPLAYPVISVWGREYMLNTHRVTQQYQKLKAIVTCPEGDEERDRSFRVINNYPGNSFWMRKPELVAIHADGHAPLTIAASKFFPVGIFGAGSENLQEIKKLGLNSAILPLARENIETCLALGMRCTFAVPREPERLIVALDRLQPLLRQGLFAYYVNDEPGIHSFPEGKAEDIQRIIKQRFPGAPTSMAIVRPQVIPFYEKGADYFMLDQYPVPGMPMTWLSESMDEAARYVGSKRLQTVVQAFGGENHAASGWPRLPTFEEMNNLAFLSLIHGSRGLYFYTFSAITATGKGRNELALVINRLNSLGSWLQVDNDNKRVALRMLSTYRFDPQGKPAIHCSSKEQYGTQLLICANTINTFAEAEIEIPAERASHWQEYFTATPYPVVGGKLLVRFKPLGVKVLMESK